MEKRNFDEWLGKFRASIASYDYYIDFDKVYRNVENVKVELNILNSLIGSKDIEKDFRALLKKYPEVLDAIPILLAKREQEIYCQDENGGYLYQFNSKKYPVDSEETLDLNCYFMRKTGLFELLQNHVINNLVDYVTGVETGLDSNGRKNRGGHLMEDLVESYIKKAGFVKDSTYFKEMYLKEIESRWNIDLSALSNQGKAAKRFDFVIKTENQIYGIETNFYTGGGSKLNETARSYKMLSQEADTIDGFTFVWFTDGIGWKSARGNLRETFDVMENIYSIDDIESKIMRKIFK
ncbi:Type II restriction enzyme DpnII [Lachnospiraceae bacterium TWA4]|nr:Type II restriction enzyme DpnII [Lachnospiraceae bacterium TWA4]